MTARINFFGFSDDKLFYDERKKRFVYMQDAPAIVEKSFKNSHFKEVFHLKINLALLIHSISKDQISTAKS